MHKRTVEPKKTALFVARLGDNPSFVVDVPDTDSELQSVTGDSEVTLTGLGQEFYTNYVQAQVSKLLAKNAVTVDGVDDEGKTVKQFVSQPVSASELEAIMTEAVKEAGRLIRGERASSGRKSEAAIRAEVEAENRARQIAQFRAMLQAAPDKATRTIMLQLAEAQGYTELVAEFAS